MSKKRSAIKAITYRIIATAILGLVSWIYTGDVIATSGIALTFAAIATILYYFHERIWNKINWEK